MSDNKKNTTPTGVGINVYLYDENIAVLEAVAAQLGTASLSQALRYVLNEWMRLTGYQAETPVYKINGREK